jgi:hypothetical protein
MLIMDETQESKTSRPSARSQGLVLKPQNPIGTSVAWTFRIRWDDSQAIIRTWQILPWRLPAVDFRDFTMAECFLGVLQGAELQRTDLLVHVCVVLDLKIWDNKTLWRRNSFLWSTQQNSMASQLFPLKHWPPERERHSIGKTSTKIIKISPNIPMQMIDLILLDQPWSDMSGSIGTWLATAWVSPAPLHLTSVRLSATKPLNV